MHLFMIITAVAVAYWLRSSGNIPQGNWHLRWQKTLFLFLFPPLLIFMTVTAVVCMGTQGKMGGMYTNSFSYILALISLGFFNILGLKLVLGGWKAIKSARECPQLNLNGKKVRILQTGALFAGQIGFWQPELVVSEGLLETLSPIHLESVLAHEQGHYQYRDTFWFFWLGWMRSCTAWLPNTEPLWQELLVLRELRADSYAASQVDPLVLAESLLLVVSNNPITSDVCCAALGAGDRLEQRIEALLTPPEPISAAQLPSWRIFLLAFLPLITVVFHT
ncbi:M56 family metallopeptidase [Dolichospermum circinale CS-1225]|uniref:M56 family metallopeptidase n=1 Tax=Dolichospermum circinale CS-537/01 TaxID=3021739 RepID=A0ABT4ZZW3_9CYAN|nr:M56 family metallopeptidase [Dolichospermum circinale]MDB9456905.1 M56 family metallopeptidase [Dolichospermum circinale CS-545/17]MDB9466096.1 M56 family metallopeptidase [Dolichospermum circinale CS-539/09]MDB9470940.1 M56 family metallopeptidase [Dolichospermum circinale CS-539]MDB9485210.1 M56 family metallopeptidase [Dolichospermum circinale CS-537/01]MDB9523866.1 M56 family metallopeptidase [Dolichospermum circinale CS-1225]